MSIFYPVSHGVCVRAIVGLCFLLNILVAMVSGAIADADQGVDAFERGDFDTALEELTFSSREGDARAQFYLAKIYWDGHSVRKDTARATRLFEASSDQGYAPAQAQLGVMYLEGRGKPRDPVRAREYFELAAVQNESVALGYLGSIYLLGLGVDRDVDKALPYLQEAARLGNSRAETELGFLYLHGLGVSQDYALANRWFERAILDGDDRAKTLLANNLMLGVGTPRDQSRGLRLLTEAAENGFPNAQYMLGLNYANGVGVNRDLEKGLQWVRRAANQQHSGAQAALGNFYYWGQGVPKDVARAEHWYQLSSDQGDPHAELVLASLIISDEVDRPISEAVGLLERSLASEHPETFLYVAGLNFAGEQFEENLVMARSCVFLAESQNLDNAQMLEHRDYLESELSKEEIERARSMANQNQCSFVLLGIQTDAEREEMVSVAVRVFAHATVLLGAAAAVWIPHGLVWYCLFRRWGVSGRIGAWLPAAYVFAAILIALGAWVLQSAENSIVILVSGLVLVFSGVLAAALVPRSYLKVGLTNGFENYSGAPTLKDIFAVTFEGLPRRPTSPFDLYRTNEKTLGFLPNTTSKNILVSLPLFLTHFPFVGLLGSVFLLFWPRHGRSKFREHARTQMEELWQNRYPIVFERGVTGIIIAILVGIVLSTIGGAVLFLPSDWRLFVVAALFIPSGLYFVVVGGQRLFSRNFRTLKITNTHLKYWSMSGVQEISLSRILEVDGTVTLPAVVVAVSDDSADEVHVAKAMLPSDYGFPADILAELIERCVEEYKTTQRAEGT